MKKTEKSTNGLRDALFEQLDGLRDGSKTPQEAKAVASLASQIVSVTRLEMEAARFVSGSVDSRDLKKITGVKL